MSALTAPRDLSTRYGANAIPFGFSFPVADNVVCFAGGLAVIDTATGYVKPGVAGTGLVAVGVFQSTYDNTFVGHTAGSANIVVVQGAWPMNSGTSGDAITAADRGQACYVLDDQTVALTSNGNTRSPAGIIIDVVANGSLPQVFVQFGIWQGVPLAAAEISATGIVFTQTYATATATVPTPTAATLTDSTGGTPSATLAAITVPTAIVDSTTGTPSTTLAAITTPPALTNSTGGTPSTTLAAITQIANAGSADVAPVANALAQLAVTATACTAAIALLKNDAAQFAASQAQNITALGLLKNDAASLATQVNALTADALVNRQLINKLINALTLAGITTG